MHRQSEPLILSRRLLLKAVSSALPLRLCLGQEFTVSSSDAEKAARDYLADLVGGEERGASFWFLDRNFNRERDALDASRPNAVSTLKQRWTTAISADRRSKSLEAEAFSSDAKVQQAWEKRHPGLNYSDPSHLCWLVFRKGVQIEAVSAGEKEANFDNEKLWIHLSFRYQTKDDSPAIYDMNLKQEKKLHHASATLWINKPNRNAHLYVYDECWLSDISYWQ